MEWSRQTVKTAYANMNTVFSLSMCMWEMFRCALKLKWKLLLLCVFRTQILELFALCLSVGCFFCRRSGCIFCFWWHLAAKTNHEKKRLFFPPRLPFLRPEKHKRKRIIHKYGPLIAFSTMGARDGEQEIETERELFEELRLRLSDL